MQVESELRHQSNELQKLRQEKDVALEVRFLLGHLKLILIGFCNQSLLTFFDSVYLLYQLT